MDRYTVFDKATGCVDMDASIAAYAEALAVWVSENETPLQTIEDAVEEVFDDHHGRIPMSALISMAVAKINTSPDRFRMISNRCHSYITGQCSNNTGRLEVIKGNRGGVARLARPGEPIPTRQMTG